MKRLKILISFLSLCVWSFAQNDLDAIRYSRGGINGSARFNAMGGAFGAVGADLSCGAFNPAGLALYRKGDISYSFGLKSSSNQASIYNKSTSISSANIVFNNFGIATAWQAKNDPDSRNVLSFSNTQLQNFNSSTRMSAYTNSGSIAKDMLNLAQENGNPNSLNYSYEGLAFDNLLLDTIDGHFISMLDTKRTIKQTRDLVTSGKQNEINFSYAYSYKDEYYFGLSVGIPKIQYTSTTTHTEVDDKDSTRIGFTSASTYTNTFVDGLPYLNGYYRDYLGFNSLVYTEYFKTTGSGINLKLGGIARLSDAVRVGVYFHSPTYYSLTDEYYNSISVSYDAQPKAPIESKDPANGGYFQYHIITPSKFSVNGAYIIKKIAVIGLDYELVNYSSAQLTSTNLSDFSEANTIIKNKYKSGHNVRLGAELNIKPLMIRAGYSMQGSPYGNSFTGNFVRHTVSAGVGFRTKNNFYVDVLWNKLFSSEDYLLFKTLSSKAKLSLSSTMLAVTVGIKF